MLANSRKKGGFTLIELLVVIAIIAILAAILFPVFARAREAARKSSCQSNMKELGIAINLYYGDYDGMLPSSVLYVPNSNPTAWDQTTSSNFCSTRGEVPPPATPGTGTRWTWAMLLYPHMKNKDIIWCPSDPNVDLAVGPSDKILSYWWKAAIDRAWFGDATFVARKEGDFDFPADQVVFFEHNGWHWGDTSKGFSNSVTLNMTFIDGHVSSKRIRESGASGVTVEKTQPSGEPLWFNYSFGAATPGYAVGTLFNPQMYGDNLP